uniref:Spermatogenesis-associated protein 13 n=1 Tax=Clastoptera arizonana TaxID=38151 RepID=A0A1B6CGV1_9HEMI
MCSMSGGDDRSSWRHSWHSNALTLPADLPQSSSTLSLDLSPETTPTANQNGLFPWSRRIDSRSNMHSPAPTLRPPTPETARTAPATPVREMGLEVDRQNGKISSGLAKTSRFSSTPLLDPPDADWEINRPWPQAQKDHQRLPDKDISQSNRNISGNSAESVLQKFRKSFSLRFYKKGGGNSKEEEEEYTEQLPPDSPPRHHTPPPLVKEDSLEKFRIGPLVWRTSKERKKYKKAARNAKCNSGDSGIQIEMVGRTTGDSSESHDTDHLADDEPLDDTDSPVIRRRGTNSSSDGKPSRPTSDVINQILIDKLKADLQARSVPRRGGHQNVRRTHSDLGGQRLFNWDVRNSYRRMFSSPSPIKMKPHLSPRKNALDTPLRSSKRFNNRPQQLRRSISQPLGINELSPLLRRKPSTSGRSHVLSEDERGATSDDEMMSDSESSVASLTDRKKSFEQAMDEEVVILAEAVWDHVAMETEELAFRAGDVIEVLDTLDRDWWWGARGDQSGWFPSAFVRLRVSQEDTVEDCLAAMASGGSNKLRRRTSISLLSNDQVRSRVVRELINTERDFVKVLRDVAEGYLAECRRRTDMFSDEQIETIFGNLEQLLDFQSLFLEDLERNVDWDAPHRSCVGDTFLIHQNGFRMYSEYCNSHPMATATLTELNQRNNYSKFFEACRLMRGLIEIPLDGYLLTPVQRICKYPLQLAELLKYTKADHPDHDKITKALEAMRGVAVLINERKRRMESLEKLAAWQQRVEGWEGEDLIESSSQLIYQGEAVRVTSGMWTNNIILFLFDHQLIYCKKDILKRNTYVYKGRIQMDTSEVINLTDGKEPQLGVSVRNGIKVYSCIRDKWLLFCCRTAQEKNRWMESFAQERRMVEQDLKDGLEFAPAARHLARMAAARSYRRPPSKPRNKNYKRGNSDATVTDGSGARSNGVSHSTVNSSSHHSLGRRMGTWFTFGSNKKGRGLGRAATLQTVVHPS